MKLQFLISIYINRLVFPGLSLRSTVQVNTDFIHVLCSPFSSSPPLRIQLSVCSLSHRQLVLLSSLLPWPIIPWEVMKQYHFPYIYWQVLVNRNIWLSCNKELTGYLFSSLPYVPVFRLKTSFNGLLSSEKLESPQLLCHYIIDLWIFQTQWCYPVILSHFQVVILSRESLQRNSLFYL